MNFGQMGVRVTARVPGCTDGILGTLYSPFFLGGFHHGGTLPKLLRETGAKKAPGGAQNTGVSSAFEHGLFRPYVEKGLRGNKRPWAGKKKGHTVCRGMEKTEKTLQGDFLRRGENKGGQDTKKGPSGTKRGDGKIIQREERKIHCSGI